MKLKKNNMENREGSFMTPRYAAFSAIRITHSVTERIYPQFWKKKENKKINYVEWKSMERTVSQFHWTHSYIPSTHTSIGVYQENRCAPAKLTRKIVTQLFSLFRVYVPRNYLSVHWIVRRSIGIVIWEHLKLTHNDLSPTVVPYPLLSHTFFLYTSDANKSVANCFHEVVNVSYSTEILDP